MLPAVAKKSAMIALARVVSRDGEAYDGKTKRAARGGPFFRCAVFAHKMRSYSFASLRSASARSVFSHEKVV